MLTDADALDLALRCPTEGVTEQDYAFEYAQQRLGLRSQPRAILRDNVRPDRRKAIRNWIKGQLAVNRHD